MTAGSASPDPTRWPVVRPGPVYNVLTGLFLLAVGGFRLWFWARGVTQSSLTQESQRIQPFLCKDPPELTRLPRADLAIFFGFACERQLAPDIRGKGTAIRSAESRSAYQVWSMSRSLLHHILTSMVSAKKRKKMLQQLQPLSNFIVASVVLLATELTIEWKGLRGVNLLSPAGQTIPFIIGIGSLLRVFYVYIKPTLKARFGCGDQTESSQQAKDPPGPVPFEVIPVPYCVSVELADPELQNERRYVVRVESPAMSQH